MRHILPAIVAILLTSASVRGQLPTAQWEPLGPRPLVRDGRAIAGRATAVVVDPRNRDVVYLGTAGGGVWKSADGGANWTPLTDSQPSLAIGALAIAPSMPDTIYAGTGEANFGYDNYYGVGLLKSTDGGNTWAYLPGRFAELTGLNFGNANGDAKPRIASLAIHPTNPDVLLAAVHFPPNRHGIYRSADGGVTWSGTLLGAVGTHVAFDPADATASIVFASLGKQDESAWGVWRSGDGGRTWTKTSLRNVLSYSIGLPGRITLSVGNNRLYASIEDGYSGALLGMYKSLDRGQTWSRVASISDYCQPRCWEANALAVSPVNANTVYAGGTNTVLKTSDGGATWTSISPPDLGRNQHAMAVSRDGARLYTGNDNGAWSMTVANSEWKNLNASLAASQFSGAFVQGNSIVGGVRGGGLARYDGAWSGSACEHGGPVVRAALPNATLFASCDARRVYASSDEGVSWTDVSGALGASGDRTLPISPVAADPSSAQVAYFGTFRMWRTVDGGASWAPISGDLTPGTEGLISAIAVAPSSSTAVYAGTSDGKVLVAADAPSGTPTWQTRSAGLPARYITSIVVHPQFPATAIATLSGFSYGSDTAGHVFATYDAGLSWRDISGNLPNTPANHALIDAPSGAITVATDTGLFTTTDNGASWTAAREGLPRSPAMWLVQDSTTAGLFVATHGRGLWRWGVPDAGGSVTLAPSSADLGTVTLGTSSAPFLFTLTNGKSRGVSISSITTTQADFRVTNTCGALLPPGSSCAIEVIASPARAGEITANLEVRADDPASPHTSALRVVGEEVVPVPLPTISKQSLTFVIPKGHSSSIEQTLELLNEGTADLLIAKLWATAGFAIQSACPVSLSPGQKCTVAISARAVRGGNLRGQFVVESNAAPVRVQLSAEVVRR